MKTAANIRKFHFQYEYLFNFHLLLMLNLSGDKNNEEKVTVFQTVLNELSSCIRTAWLQFISNGNVLFIYLQLMFFFFIEIIS